ncbi:MAG: hypothetical protein WCA10_20130 [Terracidiphilus sp.]
MTELIEQLREAESTFDQMLRKRQLDDSLVEMASGMDVFPEFSSGGGSSNPGVNCTGGCRG